MGLSQEDPPIPLVLCPAQWIPACWDSTSVGLLLIPASPTAPSALCPEAAGKGEEQGRAEEIPELAAAAGGGRFL